MPRDPRKLRVFGLADKLVLSIYEVTRKFPDEEKFGLVSQMRRAAVSVPANIAEGCGRRSTTDYLRFMTIANGSAYELAYLCDLSGRLRFISAASAANLEDRCQHVAASLTVLIESLESSPTPDRTEVPAKRHSRGTARQSRSFEIAIEDLPRRAKSRRG